ncbi:AAA family ATPase [Sporomusa sphaeroides DSM 2875]|uniref:AAA family ATPase n=1 Tax=Sporomusa sphaeroides TaxID=47679 RepID=UPI00202E32F8|nr:AAA family ATPase [Sporomusa sphaeroides]MCM0757372.1 AAA family ATPase [Sporomusa sphaeroides DSM 2875]
MEDLNISEVREQVTAYLAANPDTSQEQLAKMAGFSSAALSQFMSGTYTGKNENVARKLMAAIGAEVKRQEAILTVKEPEIIETATMREIWFGMEYARDRSDVIVVYGPPGIGKTCTLRRYANENPSTLLITASPNIANGIEIMEEILEALGKKAEGGKRLKQKTVINALLRSNRMIIIDEAHFLTFKGLETLRTIFDATRCPLVLCGNPKIMEMITERNKSITGQFFSRAVRIALENRIKMEDVKRIILQNGVTLGDDCLQELLKVANTIGALRVMTKLFLFAWTISNRQQQPITLESIQAARKVIISV